jgi:hypothetical protein
MTSAIALAVSISAKADIQLQFTWNGSLWESGFSGPDISTADAIGIYAFNSANSVPVIDNPLYSVCLSPAGLLSFASANPGIWPSAWTSGVVGGQTQYWGIQNAAYLWKTFGMPIVNGQGGNMGLSGDASTQAAALEFAIWNALYTSTGYGAITPNTSYVPTSLTGDLGADFNAYNTALTATHGTIPLYAGNVLEGTAAPGDGANGGDDQEFFLLGTPVPEPSTILAGALMLLPFGASTLRILRRNRAA